MTTDHEIIELDTLAAEAVAELSSIADVVRWGVSRFNESDIYFGHGTDNPWDESLFLVSHALNMTPSVPHDFLNTRLTHSERECAIRLILERVTTQKPASYITNLAYFCDLPFYVDESVLVPRSPIGELIKKQFADMIPGEPQTIMDLCTGSGCIAIACAYAFDEAQVDALDISVDALNIAEQNIYNLNVAERVIPIQSDVFSGVPGQRYDLIVSNPPYVDAEDIADMPAEFHHEPEIGLGSGSDGLDITRVILAEACQHLTEEGVLIVEVGNSMIHLQAEFPQVPFNWLEFESGGLGVFAITRKELEPFQHLFASKS